MDIEKLRKDFPMIDDLINCKEVLWLNEKSGEDVELPFGMDDIEDAEARLARFAPYIKASFPETETTGGIIESDLVEIPKMKKIVEKDTGCEINGRLFLKKDSHLAVSGSIKARGGIYEVLKFAEKIALEKGMITEDDDYSVLTEDRFKDVFKDYSVAVGSTGNLGLSIGIISATLGFDVTVHMSADAREWKKQLLRSKGVTVVEYEDNYQIAVAEGRKAAEGNPMCHFVDDEGSSDLFLGYSVAAKRIGKQFEANGIVCDDEHPVFVYIPCGVGGAPGGVAFGLKEIFGKNMHIFFAEPTHAPCMLLGMLTGLHDGISVLDIGLDGKTAADGLAVPRASKLVGSVMESLLDGIYTIEDENLYPFLSQLADSEGIYIEPSACASFTGPSYVLAADDYIRKNNLEGKMDNASHIFWATGGNMVPEEEMKHYYEMGK